jgi:hypothetical protein
MLPEKRIQAVMLAVMTSENFSNNSDNWIGNSSAFHDDTQLTPNASLQLLPEAAA